MNNTTITLSDRKTEIVIKDFLITGYDAVVFCSKLPAYFDLINKYQEQMTNKVQDNPEYKLQTKKQILDLRMKEVLAIKDDKLRITKKEALDKEVDELLIEIETIQNERINNHDKLLEVMRANSKLQLESSELSNNHRKEKFEMEVEIVKVIVGFLAPEQSKDFDFTQLSLLAPSRLIEAVISNPENGCNEYFTMWSALKNQVKA